MLHVNLVTLSIFNNMLHSIAIISMIKKNGLTAERECKSLSGNFFHGYIRHTVMLLSDNTFYVRKTVMNEKSLTQNI